MKNENGLDNINFDNSVKIYNSPTPTGFACGIVENTKIDSDSMGVIMTLARGMLNLVLENPDFVFTEGMKNLNKNNENEFDNEEKEIDFETFLKNRRNKLN